MRLGTFCGLGRFGVGTFCSWDVLELGPFVLGRFVLGRFVGAPKNLMFGARIQLLLVFVESATERGSLLPFYDDDMWQSLLGSLKNHPLPLVFEI